jgi:predicted metal-dependent peptidase
MKQERKLKAIKIGLMRSEQFGLLRGVAMYGDTFLTTDIPTAMTNGRDCWYNPDFLFNTIANGDKGIAFVMVHEWMHKAAMHLLVYQALARINPMVTNMATDYWNNDRIILADPKNLLTEMPVTADGKPIGLHDLKYRDWTVKSIFNDLLEKQKKGRGGKGGDGTGGEDDDTDDGGSKGGDGGEGQPKTGDGGFDEHDWEGAKKLSKKEAEKVKKDITDAIRQGLHAAKRVGTGGLTDALGLEELVTPKVNWRDALRMFMNSRCRKKERSTWRDIVMPTLEGNSIKEVVFARDASGSMFFDNAATKVTSEMVSIVNSLSIDKIHLIDWDGAVEYRGVFTADQFKNAPAIKNVIGGGGTDPTCVPDCVVMLTDGVIHEWGNWTVPVLWCIANSQKVTAPVGKTINID